ncbi:SusF/SusE family outer membrane protein [Flavobacterium lindanitolerans]|uniref:SusF/SusE family outer membrane protein n=1 Tax=Flavobacterium lindanitolerans TaxID=428988 RepID=UPI002809422E|nr:SusE domain-containing protein [Flavobacterium lindanitolerans]MDQ7959939.1 SusE domain-containing protein [Flavobacterium lindanitolerans]
MKNIAKSLIALFAVLAVSCSSDDVEDRPIIRAIDGPALIAPDGGSYVLNIESANNLAERFMWTSANFGQDVAINYEIQLDAADGVDEFAEPRSLGSVIGANQLAVSVVTLNTAAIALGGVPLEEKQYVVRVKASVNDTFEPIYSNPVTISITPYQAFVPLQNLYLVGSATEYGYNNNAGNSPLFRDPGNQYKFYYTGYFTGGNGEGIKILSALGNWHPQYGSAGAGILAVSGADGSNEPSPISVPSSGYYELTIDIQEMTYSLEPFTYNPATMPTFGSVGIIGAATPGGWDADTDMTNSTANPHLWKIDNIALTQDVLKFRANDSWDTPGNWGGGTPISGQMSINGGDFVGVAAEGNYSVWFNDLDRRYIFIPR